MKKSRNILRKSGAEHGQGLVEYAIILGLLILLTVGVLSRLGGSVRDTVTIPEREPAATQSPTDNSMATVTVEAGDYIIIASGAGTYAKGQEVHCTVTVEPGASLVGWFDQNGACISTAYDFTFNIWEDKDLVVKATG